MMLKSHSLFETIKFRSDFQLINVYLFSFKFLRKNAALSSETVQQVYKQIDQQCLSLYTIRMQELLQ
jgi:hypothetical protein